MTDKADLEKTFGELRKGRDNRGLRDKILDSLGDSAVVYLTDDEKEKIVDRIIDEAPEAPVTYYFNGDDGNILITLASGDILAVITVIRLYLILGLGKIHEMLSDLLPLLLSEHIVFLHSEHTGRRKWLAARIFFIKTILVMQITCYYTW